jgi:hypothetical protein
MRVVARVPTLLANDVSDVDGCFGGAVAYDASGAVVASYPAHQSGLLVVSLAPSQGPALTEADC